MCFEMGHSARCLCGGDRGHVSPKQKAVKLVRTEGKFYQPFNVFVDGVCIGQFIPNSFESLDMLEAKLK
jgi:hypothetical protein